MMNKYVLMLFGYFLFSFSSIAQENKPVATKGYYSIGRNMQQLVCPVPATQIQTGEHTAMVQKGYYSIGNNQDKLVTAAQPVTPATKPVIKKGYYSIGNNAEKLRR